MIPKNIQIRTTRRAAFISGLFILSCAPATATDYYSWTGKGNDSDWGNTANWVVGGAVPPGGSEPVPAIAMPSGTDNAYIDDLYGRGAFPVVSSGSIALRLLEVGRNGEGLLRIQGGGILSETNSAAIGVKAGGSGRVIVTDSGYWRVGVTGGANLVIGDEASSSGFLAIHQSGSVSVTAGMDIGDAGQGELTMSGSAYLEVGGDVYLGRGAGAAGVAVLNDHAVLRLTGTAGANTLFIGFTDASGTLILQDHASVFAAKHVTVGNSTQNAALVMSGHSSIDVKGDLVVGKGSNAAGRRGVMALTDNARVSVDNGLFQVGWTTVGYLTAGDNVVITSASGALGRSQPAYATLSGNASWTIATQLLFATAGGKGTLTLLDNAIVTAPSLLLSSTYTASSGTINLFGGTLATGGFSVGRGTAFFNLNGGAMLAIADNANFFGNIANDLVFSGTGITDGRAAFTFDTGGHSVGITNNVAFASSDEPDETALALVKNGGGMLALTGGASFGAGVVLINGGTLSLTGAVDAGGIQGGQGSVLQARTLNLFVTATGGAAYFGGLERLDIDATGLPDSTAAFTIDTAGADIVMNATITSNAPGGASGFEKNGPGMLTLAGASSIITGSMLVNAGGLVARNARFDEIAVADGALFGGSGSAASLVVGTGGTLQAGYPGTASTLDISGTLTLGAGVTLNYSILAGNQSGTLAAGYASLIAAASDYTLNLDDWLAGAYDLGNVTALAGADVKLDGRDLDVRKTYSYDTSGGRLALTIDQIANRTLVWNGTSAISADDGRWSAVAENWVASDDSTQSLIFTHYDAVFFDDRVSGPARRTIDLADNRQVSDIFVAGAGDYTFTGSGAITADASGAHNHTGGGKLVKTGGGTLTLANTGGNHFAGGVDIGGAGAAGGAIVFDRAGQLAIDADAAITFYSTGTLRHVSQNALILNANIIIAGNATATLDTGAADLTLAGGIAAGDASGTLVKTGANTLLVTSTSVGASGLTLDTSAGSTLLDGGWFSGTLYARGGAVVGGAGYAATITTAPGGALQVGRLDGFGTLSALTLALGDGAVLNYTIPAAGQSAKLEAANVNLAAAAANYTFNFTDWYSGTYDLGNVTALAGATITLNGYDLNRRQQSSYDTTGGRLRLIIDPMDNMLIVWGGASASVSGDGQWNIIHENWFAPDDATTSQPFAPGDAVLFDDRVASDARRVVTIATSLTAYSVEFSGTGRYGVIGGGSIITDAPESGDLIAGVESSSRGKLVKTGDGSVVFTNTGGNHFAAGIDLHAGIIAFTRADQIAVGGGAAINFLGAGTLQANAGIDASVPLATNIAIADAMTATIDTAGWTLVYSGSHILLGDTGTLAKTGIGTLLLTGTTRAAALTHRVIQGTLALDGADADSAVEVTSGAALSGNGIISGAVTTAAASTVRADSGLLHLASLRLVDGVSLAGTGTLGGAATLEGAVTARIPAGETLTLSGVNTGGGSLTKTGQGVLIYAGAASLGHAGGTQIDDGFVFLRNITGTDAASLTHTFTLNGGWLDLSDTLFENSGSGINDWSGIGIRQGAGAGTGGVMGQNDRITLGAGGMLANLGDGTTRGLFVVVDARDGTAILGGANLYAGYTRIDSGTLLVTADTQIGDPAFAREVILNGGVLQVGADFATSRAVELRAGGSVDVIAGVETTCGAVASATGTDAHLVKTGAGTLALSGLNEAAVTDIREGSLVALNAAGAGADVVNVSAGATLEYRDIASGTTPVSIAGSGTLRFEGAGVGANAIALTGSTTIAAIRLGGNTTVTVARDHALGTSESTIIIANGARLLLGSANVRLGHVNLVAGNGYLGFAAPVGKFKEATLTSLAGSGTLGFNVDLGARKADFLTIVNAPVGDHTIVIESTGTEPLRIDLPIAIAAMPDSDATFTLAGKRVEIGVYAFSLQSEVANARRTLSLAGASELSRMGNFIHTTAAAQWLAWYSELDSIQKRMGDLHANPAASGRINTWLRGYYQCFTYDEQATGEPFAERMFGTDAGFDVSFRNAATRATTSLGFYLGSGQTHRTFDNIAGDGWSDSACAGLYATFATRSAWHLDFVFKANRIDNRFEVHDVDFYGNRATIAGDYRDNVFGLSLELGKRLNLGKKWFFEPRIQGAGCLNPGSQYTTNNGVGVSLERGTATHALVGARLGRGTTYAGDHYLFYYVNFFGAREWNQYGRLTANGFRFDPKIVGDRIGGGLGINWIPCKGTQVHFGLDAVHAGYYDKSIGINFGFTQSW